MMIEADEIWAWQRWHVSWNRAGNLTTVVLFWMSNSSQELPYPLDASRVLRGVCDGEVLLDSKLKISGKSGEVEVCGDVAVNSGTV